MKLDTAHPPRGRDLLRGHARAVEASTAGRTTAPLRDRLVLTFAPLVKYIVYNKVREMPARCEVEDFISCGLEALIHSIDRYDPDKGATLEQYAWTRIHGAVLDELRRQDWAPRSRAPLGARHREGRRALHRRSTAAARRTEELADALGITGRRAAHAPATRSPAPTSPR